MADPSTVPDFAAHIPDPRERAGAEAKSIMADLTSWGISPRDVEDATGIPSRTVASWKNDGSPPRPLYLRELRRYHATMLSQRS